MLSGATLEPTVLAGEVSQEPTATTPSPNSLTAYARRSRCAIEQGKRGRKHNIDGFAHGKTIDV